jgi:hypothetical protein
MRDGEKNMKSWFRRIADGGSTLVVTFSLTALLALAGASAQAKDAKETTKKDKTTAGKSAAPPGVTINACGCYRKGNACVCTDRKAKCECPDDCEPVGCEEKRQKEMDKEMAAEVKRAQEEDKKREAAEAAARAKEENSQKDEEAESDQPTDEKSAPSAAKPARKDREKEKK